MNPLQHARVRWTAAAGPSVFCFWLIGRPRQPSGCAARPWIMFVNPIHRTPPCGCSDGPTGSAMRGRNSTRARTAGGDIWRRRANRPNLPGVDDDALRPAQLRRPERFRPAPHRPDLGDIHTALPGTPVEGQPRRLPTYSPCRRCAAVVPRWPRRLSQRQGLGAVSARMPWRHAGRPVPERPSKLQALASATWPCVLRRDGPARTAMGAPPRSLSLGNQLSPVKGMFRFLSACLTNPPVPDRSNPARCGRLTPHGSTAWCNAKAA